MIFFQIYVLYKVMLKKILLFSGRHPLPTLLAITVITLLWSLQIPQLAFDPRPTSLFPTHNARLEKLQDEVGQTDTLEQHIYLSLQKESGFSLHELQQFYQVIQAIETLPEISGSITPFNFLTFKNNGFQIMPVYTAPEKRAPETPAERKIMLQRLLQEPLAKGFVVGSEGTILNALFTNQPVADPAAFMRRFRAITAQLPESITIRVSGEVPFSDRTTEYLRKDIQHLFLFSVLVIAAILYIGFRTIRSILLPLTTVSLSAIWSLGFMASAGFPITIVSTVLPSLVLAIGSSYSIHFINEYLRLRPGLAKAKTEILSKTVVNISPTLFFACLTTVIGFSSLSFTSLQPLKEFGYSISFGIIANLLLSLTLLPALLKLLPLPSNEGVRIERRRGLFERLAGVIDRRGPLFIILLIGVTTLGFLTYPLVNRKVDYISYFPQKDKIVSDTLFITRHTGGGQTMNLTLKAPGNRSGYFGDHDILRKIDHWEKQLLKHPNVLTSLSFPTILSNINLAYSGKSGIPENRGMLRLLLRYFDMVSTDELSFGSTGGMTNEDLSQITIFFRVYDADTGQVLSDKSIEALRRHLLSTFKETGLDEVSPYIWGNTILFYEAGQTMQKDQRRASFISAGLVFLICLILFRRWWYGLLALIPITFALAVNYATMYFFDIPMDMTTILVASVGIGVGIDSSLHLLLRYNKILKTSERCSRPMKETLLITGKPIFFTNVSIIAGFLVFLRASFRPLNYYGLLVSITLAAAMIGSLLFIPALLQSSGKEKK